ncbi:DUF362 domain-containing protein [bacterium]|nr:MAG: DUF362 domain-containing protein [bacterium]
MSLLTRRSFLSTATAATLAAFLAPKRAAASAPGLQQGTPDLAVVKGSNYYDATIRAVDELGGMQKFVPRGSRVGLLVNSSFEKPGTYAKPQIALAVLTMCVNAGAKEVISLEDAPSSYWKRASLSKEQQDLVASIKPPGERTTVAVQGGSQLKEIDPVRDFLECDVLINVPIFKDHEGVRFTGTLKNIMGVTSYSTNRYFHSVSLIPIEGFYNDPVHLAECIAEANLVRRPTLCIGDGTEMITTNGPSGPGKIARPQVVVAGADRVAMDSFGATLLNLRPEDIPTIRRAAELGLGSMDLGKLRISRVEL